MYKADQMRYNKMEYRYSGKSGLKLPIISLGLWHNFGTYDNYDNMVNMLTTAFDNGITHFDLANNYGPVPGSAEENFGKIINSNLAAYRDEIVISTKAGYTMWEGPYGDFGSRKHILSSLDHSLKRMGLEYVDILYHHRMDPNTPLEESMGALNSAVKSGKALYAGISNYDKDNTFRAAAILKDLKCPFIINQSRYSIFDRKIELEGLKEYAGKNGIGIISFSPLAQGLLSDKYIKELPEDSRMVRSGIFLRPEHLTQEKYIMIGKLNELAITRNQSLAQMALSWVLKDNDITSVLIGASKPEQIIENLGIIGKINFTQDELNIIDNITRYGADK